MPTLTLLNPGNSIGDALYYLTGLDQTVLVASSSTQIDLLFSDGTTVVLFGTGLTTTTINGKDQISGGTVQSIQIRSGTGNNYDIGELDLSGATLGAALQAEDTNSNTAALETMFLGFDYLVNGTPDRDTSVGVSRSVDNISLTLTGANIFDAGDGNDAIIGGTSNDYIFGGDGDDLLSGGNGNDVLDGGNNNDSLNGGAGNDTLTTGAGFDILIGGTGNDLLKASPGLTAGSAFDGGNDIDTLSYAGLTSAYSVDLGTGSANVSVGGSAVLLINIENVIGSDQGDQIVGNDADNLLEGRGGNDTLSGLDGNDTLIAGSGLDSLFGGAGNDEVRSDPFLTFAEVFDGGADNDTLSFAGLDAAYIVNLATERAGLSGAGYLVVTTGFENAIGGQQGDSLTGNGQANLLDGRGGNDTLFGHDGNDTLIGGGLDTDFLFGGADNDVLQTGASGLGPGDETYDGDDGIDTFSVEGLTTGGYQINLANGTADTLISGSLVTLTEIENVIGSDDRDIVTGSTGSNVLSGGGGVDSLIGGDGNDTLTGGTGRDSMAGGAGEDDFGTITAATGFDDLSGGDDFDRVSFAGTTNDITADAALASYTVASDPATYTLSGIESLTTGSGNDTIIALGASAYVRMDAGDGDDLLELDSLLLTVIGGAGIDTLDLSGLADDVSVNLAASALISGIESLILAGGNDSAIGTSGADTLSGGAGNDTLDGGQGDDTVIGGAGDDIFRIGMSDGAADFFGGADSDTLDLSALASTALSINLNAETYNSGVVQGVENAIGANLGDTLTGDDADNTLQGLGGGDMLTGGFGDDLLEGGIGNDTLIGGTGTDRLFGGANDDSFGTITETTATDALFGGTGIDRVSYTGIAANLHIELDNGSIPLSDGSFRAVRIDSVEIVTTGSGNDTIMARADTVRIDAGGGNDLVVLKGTATTAIGGSGTDRLDLSQMTGVGVTINLGTSIRHTGFENAVMTNLDDTVTGTGGTNIIEGFAGRDKLNGGAGGDTLVGGAGSDTYVVDSAGDRVFDTFTRSDLRDAGGTDTVQSIISFSLGGSAVLGRLENLSLTGSLAISGTGNTLAISGTGNTLANTITGNGAANSLNGGGGLDSLSGGAGNDTYVTDGGDTIAEAVGKGTDLVQSFVTFTLGVNLENLTMTGTASIDGTGNGTSNRLAGNSGNNVLNGGGGSDTMAGGAGNDTYVTNGNDTITEAAGQGTDLVQASATSALDANLENLTLTGSASIRGTGNSGANHILGNTGNNVLDGGGGSDTMAGGAGNDTYITDGGDTITEASFAGTDHVQSLASFTLGANLERLTLTGSAAIDGTGNALANTIIGNGGVNVLNGMTGNDTLTGGGGQDIFIFNTALSTGNSDRIMDFNAPADTIRLENAVFLRLANGTLGADAFRANLSGNATDATDRIIYEADTGKLYFDRDGTGGIAKVEFGILGTGIGLSNTDFFVF